MILNLKLNGVMMVMICLYVIEMKMMMIMMVMQMYLSSFQLGGLIQFFSLDLVLMNPFFLCGFDLIPVLVDGF